MSKWELAGTIEDWEVAGTIAPDVKEEQSIQQLHEAQAQEVNLPVGKWGMTHMPKIDRATGADWDKYHKENYLEPSYNPMVHIGKELTDLSTGTKQLLGLLSDEEYAEWEENNRLYNKPKQPLSAKLAGDLLLAAPGFASAPGRLLIGQAVKKAGAKGAGEEIMRNAAYTGATMAPRILPPGTISGISGASYMAAQPVSNKLSPAEQAYERTRRASIGAVAGVAGDWVTRFGASKAQQLITDRLKKDMQGSLPLPVEIPTTTLYKDVPGTRTLTRAASSPGVGIRQGAASRQLELYRQSLLDNFKVMNKQTSGSTNERVGESITGVMRKYKDLWNESKGVMNAAYNNVKRHGSIIGDVADYKTFIKSLENEMSSGGIPLVKGAKTAFNELKRVNVLKDKVSFDGKSLIARYKALNSIYSTAKPRDQRAIEYMKKRLGDYMAGGRLVGDKEALTAFKDATSVAAAHYNKFHGNKVIDDFLQGNVKPRPADISRRMFSSEALDYMEAPKAELLNKILSVVPNSKNSLRNEVFANLTDEIGRNKVEKAIPNIQKHILSGSEEGVYKRIFDEDTLKQFTDLKLATDFVQNTPDFGRKVMQGARYSDLTKLTPTKLIGPLEELARIFRSERGVISPSGDITSLGRVPLTHALSSAEKENMVNTDEQERSALAELLLRLKNR